MQPADTALTRMYNQPTQKLPNGQVVGLLYKNPIDCLWKTLKTEGALGWYKGIAKANFVPLRPCINLLFRNYGPLSANSTSHDYHADDE